MALVLWSVAVTLAYAPSLSGGYVYEDIPDRLSRDRFAAWSGWAELAALPSRPARSVDRALTLLTQRFSGGSPFVARSLSLALHLLNGWLVWLVARSVLAEWGAVAAAAIFLAHPIQTEAVAYVAARPELITGTWLLLALLASRRSVALAGVCAALAITGKELGVMAWALVPMWAWWTGQRWTRLEIACWGTASVVFGALFLRGVDASGVFAWAGPLYVAGQLTALARLLLLWPEALVHPSALTIDHDWRWITRSNALIGATLWAWALLAAHRRHWPLWGCALLLVLVAALPRLLFPFLDGQHERHLYAGSIAVSLAFGSLFMKES